MNEADESITQDLNRREASSSPAVPLAETDDGNSETIGRNVLCHERVRLQNELNGLCDRISKSITENAQNSIVTDLKIKLHVKRIAYDQVMDKLIPTTRNPNVLKKYETGRQMMLSKIDQIESRINSYLDEEIVSDHGSVESNTSKCSVESLKRLQLEQEREVERADSLVRMAKRDFLTEEDTIRNKISALERRLDTKRRDINEKERMADLTRRQADELMREIEQEKTELATKKMPKDNFRGVNIEYPLESTRRRSAANFFVPTKSQVATNSEKTKELHFPTARTYKRPSPANRMLIPQEAVDAWIDHLEPNQSGKFSVNSFNMSVEEQTMLSLQLNSRILSQHHLSPITIPSFSGTPLEWPNFIELFFDNVHSSLDDDGSRMVRLVASLTGVAKRHVDGLGTVGSNYIVALSELKHIFGQRVTIARAFLEKVVDGRRVTEFSIRKISDFHSEVRDIVINLKKMRLLADLYSIENVRKTAMRIPAELTSSWNKFVTDMIRADEMPSLLDFEQWLWERCEELGNPFSPNLFSTKIDRDDRRQAFPKKNVVYPLSGHSNQPLEQPRMQCFYCNGFHSLSNCDSFRFSANDTKRRFLLNSRLCFNCLEPGHLAISCRFRNMCRVCPGKHHSAIHGLRVVPNRLSDNNQPDLPPHMSGVANSHVSGVNGVQFQLLPVVVKGPLGSSEYAIAVLDSASQISIIHPKLKQKLGLKGSPRCLTINTLCNKGVSQNTEVVKLSVRSAHDESGQILMLSNVFVVESRIPHPARILKNDHNMTHLQDIPLTDIEANKAMILIGADNPLAHFQLERRVGQQHEPVGIKTPLGWTLIGSSGATNEDETVSNMLCCDLRDQYNMLQEQVERFWSTEAVGTAYNLTRSESIEDRQTDNLMERKIRFIDGHYEVGFMWRNENCEMPQNEHVALNRFENLRKRLQGNERLRNLYCKEMAKNIERGWVRKLTSDEKAFRGPRAWFLPHHGVENPNKPNKL
ncbi:uncharacterized protein LOC144431310 [Styela clava]